MKFTRREIIVLAIAAVFYVVTMLVEQRAIDRFEWLVPPVVIVAAWFINTDPERRQAG